MASLPSCIFMAVSAILRAPSSVLAFPTWTMILSNADSSIKSFCAIRLATNGSSKPGFFTILWPSNIISSSSSLVYQTRQFFSARGRPRFLLGCTSGI